jgi:glycosyltransferase involved in cell wall biosynthesis
MHVIHLVDKFRDGRPHGGLSTVVAQETRAMAARGHRITVVARRYDHAIPLQERLDDIEIVRFDSANPLDTAKQVHNIVRCEIDKGPVNIIHSHMATVDFAATRSLPTSIPVVRTFHGDWPMEVWFEKEDQPRRRLAYLKDSAKRLLQEYVERQSMARAHHIVVLSPFSKEYVMRKYKRRETEISVIAPGIDAERFRPTTDRRALRRSLGLPEEAPLILFAGRLIAWKGPQRILAAFAQIASAHTDAVLLLVGKGTLERSIRAQVCELGLEARVIFAGFQHERMPDYYAAADLLVVASTREETFGMVTIEALACGAPVIGSPYGATPDLLNAIDPRLVLPDAEASSIAGVLDRFFREGWRAGFEAQRLHNSVEQRFRWEGHNEALLSLYQDLITAKAPAHLP